MLAFKKTLCNQGLATTSPHSGGIVAALLCILTVGIAVFSPVHAADPHPHTYDAKNADIAGVKLGMTYAEAKAALVKHFGISDTRIVREECMGVSREEGSLENMYDARNNIDDIEKNAFGSCPTADFNSCVHRKVLPHLPQYAQCYCNKIKEIHGRDRCGSPSYRDLVEWSFFVSRQAGAGSYNKDETLNLGTEYDNVSKTEVVRTLYYHGYRAKNESYVVVSFSKKTQTVYSIEFSHEGSDLTAPKDLDPKVVVAKYGVPTATDYMVWCTKFYTEKHKGKPTGEIGCPDWCEQPFYRKQLSNASCPGSSDQARLSLSPNKRLMLEFRAAHEARLWR
jgi:hypothetical protein